VEGGVILNSVGFTDLTSFSGLQCVGAGLGVIGNPNLTSLDGLNSLDAVNYQQILTSPPSLVVENNTLLGNVGNSSIAALSLVCFSLLASPSKRNVLNH
jgi:hypothetical protein